MKHAIVTINGFRETPEHQTGTERLWQTLRPYASEDVLIHPPVKWTHDPDEMVGFLQRQGVERVAIVAYSWGAGYGAVNLAKACGSAGLRVPVMLLCDPVYRPTWLPTWCGTLPLAARALIPGSAEIVIPRNVRRVAGVRQTQTLPQAHALRVSKDFTVIEHFPVLPYTHTTIDDAPEWWSLVQSKIQQFAKDE